jgi:hypothetical protein
VVTEEQQLDLKEREKTDVVSEPAMAAVPGQVTSLRRLGGRGAAGPPEGERKKRGWGASRNSRLRQDEKKYINLVLTDTRLFLISSYLFINFLLTGNRLFLYLFSYPYIGFRFFLYLWRGEFAKIYRIRAW